MPSKRTQKTAQGADIPIPKRGEFLGNLKKIATHEKSKNSRAAKKR